MEYDNVHYTQGCRKCFYYSVSYYNKFKNCILIKDVRVIIDIFYTANFVAMQWE